MVATEDGSRGIRVPPLIEPLGAATYSFAQLIKSQRRVGGAPAHSRVNDRHLWLLVFVYSVRSNSNGLLSAGLINSSSTASPPARRAPLQPRGGAAAARPRGLVRRRRSPARPSLTATRIAPAHNSPAARGHHCMFEPQH